MFPRCVWTQTRDMTPTGPLRCLPPNIYRHHQVPGSTREKLCGSNADSESQPEAAALQAWAELSSPRPHPSTASGIDLQHDRAAWQRECHSVEGKRPGLWAQVMMLTSVNLQPSYLLPPLLVFLFWNPPCLPLRCAVSNDLGWNNVETALSKSFIKNKALSLLLDHSLCNKKTPV